MTRLPASATQRIDPNRKLSFTYAGKAMTGLAGDTVATALYANGVRVFGRSLKYHRPRGLYSLDGETANTLMNVDGEPNVRAETTRLKEGMKVLAQNVSGGNAESDAFAFIDKFDGFMPAGFYYQRFHKPYALWPLIRDRLRSMAGAGRVDESQVWDHRRLEELHLNAEVLIIGGGPAGMSAALAAAEFGLRVVLFEARPWLGGFFDWRPALHRRGRELAAKLEVMDNVRVFSHASVINLAGDNLAVAFQVGGEADHFDERYLEVRAGSVVVAAGCIERPLIFEHNDRPGVMQVGCAHRLARTYGLLPGQKAVFSVGDDLGLEAAFDLAELGLEILALADARSGGYDPWLVEALKAKGIPFLSGWAVSEARGKKGVTGAVLGALDGSRAESFSCDLIVASAGLTPLTGPLSTAGAKLAYDARTGFFLPRETPPGVHAAGRLLGYTDPAAVEASGRLAGLAAARDAGADVGPALNQAQEALAALPGPAEGCKVVTGPNIGSGKKSFICFDEDGTYKTARQSVERGFDVPELAKRFGGFGLGPSQAGAPGHNLPLVLAAIKGESPEGLRPTTVRSPLIPINIGTLAGPKHDIFKRTPLHDDQLARGAIMRRVGVWKRARYFSQDFASRTEIENVRTNVGLIDVSTLGKFRLHGPDALRALQRVYISNMEKMILGKLKYSAMLNEDGNLIDDGVVTKIGENDYYFTTSTGRAGATAEWLRYHTRYEGWDFHLVNLTDALGAINLAGPRAREVLAKVVDGDVSNEAFPFMGFRLMSVGGKIPARISRLGFVGELSYELHVPASYTQAVWDLLMAAGEEFGIKPFGLEAQFVLRLEKGHVIIGQESEARTNLLDLGLGFLWDRDDTRSGKIGAPALRFAQDQPDRLKLVGLVMDDPDQTPGDGAIVYEDETIMGFVCTSRYSVTLNKSIALALIKAPLAKVGGRVNIYQNDGGTGERGERRFTAAVVKTPFYDPEGARLKM